MSGLKKRHVYFFLSLVILCCLIFTLTRHPSACAWGPGSGPGGGPGRMGSGPYSGFGMGQGMGLNRGFGCGAGQYGMDMQMGMLSDPPYCNMLLNRPDLKLTAEQKESLRSLQIQHVKDTFNLRSDLQVSKIELRKLRFVKNPDFEKIKERLEKISKIQLDLQIKRAKLQVDADKILTDEQRDALFLSPEMAFDKEWEDTIGPEETP